MAGRARTKALQEALEKRAREASDLDGELPMSTLDYVCEWLERGATVKELALSLTQDMDSEVTYDRVMAVLRAGHGADAVDTRLAASRARASHCMVETAMELVDAPADTTVEVSRAASRAKTRLWTAEKWNRKDYGQDKGVSVTVTVGSLHLDALRAAPPRVTGSIIEAQISTTAQPALPSGDGVNTE